MSRQSVAEIEKQYESLEVRADFIAVVEQLPNIAFVVNRERQIVYGNREMLDELGLTNVRDALNYRPGELFRCIHATGIGGCGEADACRYCGAVNAVCESQVGNRTVTKEARVTINPAGSDLSLDLRVTASPLSIDDQRLTLVFFSDISDQKRREYLEEIFLHDTRNTLHALSLMGDVLRAEKVPEETRDAVSSIQRYVKILSDDLNGHQLLINAEKGYLKIHPNLVSIEGLLQDCMGVVAGTLEDRDIVLQVENSYTGDYLLTDPNLARRVLVNAVKNAFEATPAKGEVLIRVTGDDACLIEVVNPGEVDAAVRNQVFQRSFSTKGIGRGLGTYSMRLLLERYLGGKISFTSSAEAGTCFNLQFPSREKALAELR